MTVDSIVGIRPVRNKEGDPLVCLEMFSQENIEQPIEGSGVTILSPYLVGVPSVVSSNAGEKDSSEGIG